MAAKDINDVRQWSEFCEKLAAMTASGDLAWEDWSSKISRPDVRSPLFVATYKAWHILIYRYAFKYFYDEDRFEWYDDVAVELINPDGRNDWRLPKVPTRYQLLDHIQFTSSDAQSLLDEILSDE